VAYKNGENLAIMKMYSTIPLKRKCFVYSSILHLEIALTKAKDYTIVVL